MALAAAVVLHGCSGGNGGAAPSSTSPPANPVAPRSWDLVWSDEFDGGAVDEANWNFQLGDGTAEGIPGWGNNELQTYRRANATVGGGVLTITARAETVGRHAYTSARINTARRFDFQYGRIEASIQVPGGRGLWSAFWMLPTGLAYGTWAASGEIDIMEVYSRTPTPFTQGVVHYGMAWPLNVFSAARYDGIDPADGFHTYALEWDAEELRWFVDGVHFRTVTRATYWTYYLDGETNAHRSGPVSAPFDMPFHLLLNVAVGGTLPGDPDPNALPGEMRVDYVRVYQCSVDAADGLGCDGLADPVNPSVQPPPADDVFRAVYDIYTDSLLPLAVAGSVPTVALDFGVDGALVLTEVDGGEERGTVLDVYTAGGGSMSVFPADRSRQRLFGMGSASAAGSYGGELQFDLYVFGDETDAASGLQVKLDSGVADLGFVELPVAELPLDQWTTVTVQISDVARNPGRSDGGPVDLDSVLGLFVLEPTSYAHVRLDNVMLLCGHPLQGGCGIAPRGPARDPDETAEPVDVYVDAVGPTWDAGIKGADSGSGWVNYSDAANPDNKVQWREIDAADPARGVVLEVTFTDSAASGVWFIQSTRGVDLTAYRTGHVGFDIKVDDYGANADGMTMKIDCVFPCTSGDQPIGKVGDGAWETVRIPVSQLLRGGLDLSNVDTGLVIFPTDLSVALTFQMDNVRWLPPEPANR